MKNDRILIIALIAFAVVILAGVIVFAPHSPNQNHTAYEIPLKTQDFSFFEMAIPQGSNFSLKNNQTEIGKGMYYWQNNGNFSNETDSIIISKNYTDRLIPATMELISQNDSEKVYLSEGIKGQYYKVVKTVNDTDIIVSGYNLPLLEEMLNTTNVKNTSKLTLREPVKNLTAVEKAPAETEQVIERIIEKAPKAEDKPIVETTKDKEPLMIGGGSFTTGSELEDRTYARIYVGIDYAGETVGIKIFYFRDGVNLNTGNYVRATVDDSGYLNIASADAYSKYPDFAYVEVYDASGTLQSTQGIHLEPVSGTQYF